MVQQQQLRGRELRVRAAAAAEERTVTYEWSWQQRGRSQFPETASDFDQQHPVPAELTLQAIITLLKEAAAALEATASGQEAQQAQDAAATPPATLPSQAWLQQVLTAAQPLLQASPSFSCEALQLLSQLDFTPPSDWMQAVLQGLCSSAAELSTQQLAGLVWSLSNLRYTPTQQQWQVILTAAQAKLEDFYGPDLALLVCGAGSISISTSSSFDPAGGLRQQHEAGKADEVAPASEQHPEGSLSASSSSSTQLPVPDGWADAVLSEVQYQVTEFPADLGAFDLARMASGLADLGISPSTQLQDKLMKAVYMRTRTIEEKGAVDFALAKLDAKGKKSMHYDPRWTHEELKWLPRRERDKRRIIKDGWYRTQWTGWR